MVEVQILQEQISVRPSMGIFTPPSLAPCDIPPIHGHKKTRFSIAKTGFRYSFVTKLALADFI
jgi:hypothetical protein